MDAKLSYNIWMLSANERAVYLSLEIITHTLYFVDKKGIVEIQHNLLLAVAQSWRLHVMDKISLCWNWYQQIWVEAHEACDNIQDKVHLLETSSYLSHNGCMRKWWMLDILCILEFFCIWNDWFCTARVDTAMSPDKDNDLFDQIHEIHTHEVQSDPP